MGPHGTVHTDFTVVANNGGPMCADPADVLQAARSGAHDPDHFVVQKGDRPKKAKYDDDVPGCGLLVHSLRRVDGGPHEPGRSSSDQAHLCHCR